MRLRLPPLLLLGSVCRPALSVLVHPAHLWRSSSCSPRSHVPHTKPPIGVDHSATALAARRSPAFLSDEGVSCYRDLDKGSTVSLVGVVHNARRSSKLVERVIRKVQPQVVMVEVDACRVRLLPPGEAIEGEDGLCWWRPLHEPDETNAAAEDGQDWDEDIGTSAGEDGRGLDVKLKKSVRRKRQSRKDQAAHDEAEQEVCEFYTAAVEAVACGARVLLGDRDFEETQRRLGAAEKEDEADRARPRHGETGQKRMVEARIKRRGLESASPAVWRKLRDLEKSWRPRKFAVLMTERDKVMSNNLMRLEGNQDTVAVIGAHHTVGIGNILETNGWKTRR